MCPSVAGQWYPWAIEPRVLTGRQAGKLEQAHSQSLGERLGRGSGLPSWQLEPPGNDKMEIGKHLYWVHC